LAIQIARLGGGKFTDLRHVVLLRSPIALTHLPKTDKHLKLFLAALLLGIFALKLSA
jgi:hypothetical protein